MVLHRLAQPVQAVSVQTKAVEEPELRAADLKQELSGTINQRETEEKSIYITLKHGEKPQVVFTGFWNGKLVRNAENAISRAYRQLRHKNIRLNATVQGG
jgi:hypothetical protein